QPKRIANINAGISNPSAPETSYCSAKLIVDEVRSQLSCQGSDGEKQGGCKAAHKFLFSRGIGSIESDLVNPVKEWRAISGTNASDRRRVLFEESGMGLMESILDRKSTRLNSSHGSISYAVFFLKKKIKQTNAEHE